MYSNLLFVFEYRMSTNDPFLFRIAVRQDLCPSDCDTDFFEEIEDVKFTIRGDVIDTSAGWFLTRESNTSSKPCLCIKFAGAESHVVVTGHSVMLCRATHPYVYLLLQRNDSIREALLINTVVFSINHVELREAWKDSTLAPFIPEAFNKESNKSGVIQMQVEKLLEKLKDSVAKKKKKEKNSKKDKGSSSGVTDARPVSEGAVEGVRGAPKKVPRAKTTSKKSAEAASGATTGVPVDADAEDELPVGHNLPSTRNADGTVVAEECIRRFKNFRDDFGKYYPLGYDTFVEVDVTKVDVAPCNYIVRVLEGDGVTTVYNTLLTQVIPNKQVLCLFPQGLKQIPKTWDEIKNLRFYAINGQHTVRAAQLILKNPDVDDARKEMVRNWKAQIVWDLEAWKIQAISDYYNQSNQINPFKPTWASNLVHVRRIWVEMGRPERVRYNASDKASPEMSKKRNDWNVSTVHLTNLYSVGKFLYHGIQILSL